MVSGSGRHARAMCLTVCVLGNLQELLQNAVRGAAAVGKEKLVHCKSSTRKALSIVSLQMQKTSQAAAQKTVKQLSLSQAAIRLELWCVLGLAHLIVQSHNSLHSLVVEVSVVVLRRV